MYHVKVVLNDELDQEALDKVCGLAGQYGASTNRGDDSEIPGGGSYVICSFPEQYVAQVFRDMFDHNTGKNKPMFKGFKRVWAYWWVEQFGHSWPTFDHPPSTEPKIHDLDVDTPD